MDATISQAEIPAVYDSLSKTYDIWGQLAETRARNRALELADIEDGQKILEVAAGTGLTFYEIVKRNPKSFGGCRAVRLSDKLQEHGFEIRTREYYQQLWFPSEVILSLKK